VALKTGNPADDHLIVTTETVIGRDDDVVAGFFPELPRMPLVLRRRRVASLLPEWLVAHRADIDSLLHRHGAILLRDFHSGSIEFFDEIARALCPELFREYGDLPREGESDQIYKSTPYPADKRILFHNESSHLDSWPMRQLFSCIVAADEGGDTPIVDCRRVHAALRPELVKQFADRGLRYVRNFIDAVDVPWRRFFSTDDPEVVERKLREAGSEFEWRMDGTLRTWRRAAAVLRHPHTDEMVFFNQISLHHSSCLEPAMRNALLGLLGPEGMPRNVFWGDGEPIADTVVDEVREVLDREASSFTWREGDILVLDNMLVAHSRSSFTGDRKVVVALGDMMTARSVATRL